MVIFASSLIILPRKMNCSECTVNMTFHGGERIVNYCDIATMIRAMTHPSEEYNCPCNLSEVCWVPTFLFQCITLLNFSLCIFLFKVCRNLLADFFDAIVRGKDTKLYLAA